MRISRDVPFDVGRWPTATSFNSYMGSGGNPHPKCIRCNGRGYYWERGGDRPVDFPSESNSNGRMPGPGMDRMTSCDCKYSGWQYHEGDDV